MPRALASLRQASATPFLHGGLTKQPLAEGDILHISPSTLGGQELTHGLPAW